MKNFLFFFLIGFQSVFSQSVLKGKIISDGAILDSVLVVNNTTKKTTYSSKDGSFAIEACLTDELVFASPKMEGLQIKLNSNSFKMDPLIIALKVKPFELDEVKVSHITAKSLGIVGKSIKDYTPAERKLYTANGGQKNLYGTNTRISVDGILNGISGRTAMLEKIVTVEKYESNSKKMIFLLTEDFFLTTLRISKESLDGFLVYASENLWIAKLLADKNIAGLKLGLVEMAFKFKEMKNE